MSPSPAAAAAIGTQTLDVIRAEAGSYEVVALGVGSSVDVLIEQALEFRPKVVAVADPSQRAACRRGAAVRRGASATWTPWSNRPTWWSTRVVGFAGLPVTIATLRAGKRLALANKESLIAAGPVVQPLRATPGRRARAGRQRALRGAPVPARRR